MMNFFYQSRSVCIWLVHRSGGALALGTSFEVKLSVHVGGSPGLADLALALRRSTLLCYAAHCVL